MQAMTMEEERTVYDIILSRRGNPSPGCCWFNGENGLDLALAWDGNGSRNITIIEATNKEFNTYFKENGIGYVLSRDGYDHFKITERLDTYDEDDLEEYLEGNGSIREIA